MDISALVDWVVDQSLPMAILAGIGWFAYFRLWPWLTEVYIPSRQAADEKMSAALELMARHMENAAIALNHFAELCLDDPEAADTRT